MPQGICSSRALEICVYMSGMRGQEVDDDSALHLETSNGSTVVEKDNGIAVGPCAGGRTARENRGVRATPPDERRLEARPIKGTFDRHSTDPACTPQSMEALDTLQASWTAVCDCARSVGILGGANVFHRTGLGLASEQSCMLTGNGGLVKECFVRWHRDAKKGGVKVG